ncbi:Protein of unknown function [Rhizobiales bacterium GAS188]|nr:Protein of unknown function [Rhizobiales bacterium GAS188]
MPKPDNELEQLRKVTCGVVLEQDGWAVDRRESTRRAVKYRRGRGEILIVIHDGAGWFDPLSDAKGDVFNLVQHLYRGSFGAVRAVLRPLVGIVSDRRPSIRPKRRPDPAPLRSRWERRSAPRPGSLSWRYLAGERMLPDAVLERAIAAGSLREGPHGSMWAAHRGVDGFLTGWEERGRDWRGFSTNGTKVLFRLGCSDALRICVAEAAIDAMSLAALEAMRCDTLYLSTGGGWGPATVEALRALATQPGITLVAATDHNKQGDRYAERLAELAAETGCAIARLVPVHDDWNEDVKQRAVAREHAREC